MEICRSLPCQDPKHPKDKKFTLFRVRKEFAEGENEVNESKTGSVIYILGASGDMVSWPSIEGTPAASKQLAAWINFAARLSTVSCELPFLRRAGRDKRAASWTIVGVARMVFD